MARLVDVRAISADGQMLLFDESGEGGGPGGSVYLRQTDGSPAVRLRTGGVGSLFGRSLGLAIAIDRGQGRRVPGRWVSRGRLLRAASGLDYVAGFPTAALRVLGSRARPRIASVGPGDRRRETEGLLPEGYRIIARSPGRQAVVAAGPDRRFTSIRSREASPRRSRTRSRRCSTGWTHDGGSLFVRRRGEVPLRVMTLDLASGRKELWKELMPAGPGWRLDDRAACRSRRTRSIYAYSYTRSLSDLYVVTALQVTLAAGTRLGPYEILAPIGAGGMGEVYRARDPRLKRDVAIKVLPASFSDDADRLRRFEQEAQAAGGSEPSEHHGGLRHRHARGRAVHRHGAARRRDAARAPGGRRAPGAQGDGVRDPDRPRARRGAREGDRPPGSEAREPLRHQRRPRQDPRLRPREADADREADGPADEPPDRRRAPSPAS